MTKKCLQNVEVGYFITIHVKEETELAVVGLQMLCSSVPTMPQSSD